MPDISPSPGILDRLFGSRNVEPETSNINYRRDVRDALRPIPSEATPTVDVAPSPNILQRFKDYIVNQQPEMGLLNKIFMTQQTDPRVGESLKRLGSEGMPEAQRGIVTPMSRWESLMKPGAQAVTDTSGTGYRPSALSGLSPAEMDQIMAHELTHQRQFGHNPIGETIKNTLYNVTHSGQEAAFSNPSEIEAYQSELNREHKGRKYLQYPKAR